jgi:hypothetical protein
MRRTAEHMAAGVYRDFLLERVKNDWESMWVIQRREFVTEHRQELEGLLRDLDAEGEAE